MMGYYNIRLDNVFQIIFSAILAYTITKERLLDISIVIKRLTSILITSILVILSFAYLLYLTKQYFVIGSILSIILGLFWAFFAIPIRDFLITTVKRKAVKGWYDSQKMFNKLATEITNEQNRSSIFSKTAKVFDNYVNFEKVSIVYAIRADDQSLKEYKYIDMDTKKTNRIYLSDPLIAYFSEHEKMCFFKELDSKSQEKLKKLKFSDSSMLIPFYSPEMMEGILVLGERSGKVPLKQADLDFFKNLAKFITVILTGTIPFEKIKKSYNDKEGQLLRSQRIASLAHTIQEYNHELRTPVQAILTEAEFLPDSEEKITILKAALRADDIINTTLSLVYFNEEKNFEKLGLNQLIKDSLKHCLINKKVSVYQNFYKGSLNIMGNKSKLEKIITNLVKNAVDAMPSGGDLTIRTYVENKQVFIQIQDTGIGIPKQDIELIWEPFRSRHVTKGRGLGLSVVHKIVREHNGKIDVNSLEGMGTTFTITFPIENE